MLVQRHLWLVAELTLRYRGQIAMSMRKRLFMPPLRLFTVLLSAGLAFTAGAQDSVRLPDLGSSANAVLSPTEARHYGGQMLHELRGLHKVLDDPLVNDYINSVGYRLVAYSADPKQKFTFFVVNDNEINAFAAPGGYIGVNAGLIDLTRNESELAAVMAHEIGHITQHHLERAFEASKKDAPLMALAVLGAIAASAGSNSGDASMAVLAGSQGLLQQRQINFTRKDEIEADRVGIQTLTRAGYDPEAMADFFQRMQDTLQPGGGSDNVPALLRTHPVTALRISDARARARGLKKIARGHVAPTIGDQQWARTTAPIPFVKNAGTLSSKPSGKVHLSMFRMMRERVRVLSQEPRQATHYYASNLHKQPGFDTPSNRYGYALALTRDSHAKRAVKMLQPLLARYPGNLPLQLAMADADLESGRAADAMAIYGRLAQASPQNQAIAEAYANALLRSAKKADASTAAGLLKPLLDDDSSAQAYQLYARASDAAGDPAHAAEAWAEVSYLSGRPFDAMEQLRRLLKRDDLNYYQRARVQASITQLTPILLELSKRHVKTPDNPNGREQQLVPDQGACVGHLCLQVQ